MIDYAGTFPPAALPYDQSFRNYQQFLNGDESWIVESLAWLVKDLPILSDLNGNGELSVAAIGRPGREWDEWQTAREQDARDMSVFLGVCQNASIKSYECVAPPMTHFTQGVAALRSYKDETDVFFELPLNEDVSEPLSIIAEQDWAYAKFRCGGQFIPTPNQLAEALKECVDLEISFKLTAGLHEPVAHDGQHGFLNIFAAIGMRFFEEATVNEMARILADEDISAFRLGQDFAYRGRAFTMDELEELRTFFLTFGSCSIDEPLAGLSRISKQ